jgi:hypothetical protein
MIKDIEILSHRASYRLQRAGKKIYIKEENSFELF